MTPSASCGGMALLEDVDELVDGLLRMNGCSSEEGFVVEGIVLAGRTIRGGGTFGSGRARTDDSGQSRQMWTFCGRFGACRQRKLRSGCSGLI